MKFVVTIVLFLALTVTAWAEETPPTGSFAFSFTTELPGQPDAMYDALTGDISGWWDHTMSGAPLSLEIEARPGGRFIEVFDESGDGVVHAMVTGAQRGKMLRLDGPLGLAGHAIHMVTTYELEPMEGGRTSLTVSVHAAGEIHDGWSEVVEKTWRHFIEGQFVPRVTAGNHQTP